MKPWTYVRVGGSHWPTAEYGGVCPDVLRFHQFCGADTPRGAVVLTFFWLMSYWPKGWGSRV